MPPHRDDFMDRPVWAVLAPPNEIQTYRDAIVRLTTTGPPLALEATLLTKHSEHRIIAWRLAASPPSDNESRSFMLTGIEFEKEHIDDYKYAGLTYKRSAQLRH